MCLTTNFHFEPKYFCRPPLPGLDFWGLYSGGCAPLRGAHPRLFPSGASSATIYPASIPCDISFQRFAIKVGRLFKYDYVASFGTKQDEFFNISPQQHSIQSGHFIP
jgi:hypothetical protein